LIVLRPMTNEPHLRDRVQKCVKRKRGKSRGGQGERALARMIWGSGGMTWLPGTANRAPR
jgi:hypothetical protein